MNFSDSEQLMCEVMKAICESGIPIDFKGSMVLKAYLLETGYPSSVRHTIDIDGNWYSDVPPTPKQMTESLQEALRARGIPLTVINSRMYGGKRSAGFKFQDEETGMIRASMDIDVNRPAQDCRLYEMTDFRFRGSSPTQILADKISVVSTNKMFRRIKDLLDLYYLSSVFPFDKNAVLETLKNNGRELDDFNGFLHRKDDLIHAYEKYRLDADVEKPPFDELYATVKEYLRDLLPEE